MVGGSVLSTYMQTLEGSGRGRGEVGLWGCGEGIPDTGLGGFSYSPPARHRVHRLRIRSVRARDPYQHVLLVIVTLH